MPTIETCFNCFRTRTYDAEIIQRRQYRPGNFKSNANSLDPPPLGVRAAVAKMAPVPEGEIVLPPALAL